MSVTKSRIRFVGNKAKRCIVSCNECRRRKKKCDEKRPRCNACTKRDVECVYQELEEHKIIPFEKIKKFIPAVSSLSSDSTLTSRTNSNSNSNSNSKTNLNQISVIGPPLVSSFDSISSGTTPIPEIQFDAIFNDDITDMFLGGDVNLELDMDFIARSVIDSFGLTYGINDDKFRICYMILLPFSFKNRPILVVLCALVLSINNDLRLTKYVDESLKIVNDLEQKINYDNNWNEDDLINYIVLLSCLTIISSINNDPQLWKHNFEKLYIGLKNVGLDILSTIIKDRENRKVLNWVMNWFFYQDVSKFIKVTQNKLIGPVFSKREYNRFLSTGSNRSDDTNDDKTGNETGSDNVCIYDSAFTLCLNLYIVLGEINSLYDQFTIRIKAPIITYYENIAPIMEKLSDEECIEFVNSEEYIKYEAIRNEFHNWVQMKTKFLENRIKKCQINTSSMTGPIDPISFAFFEIMKLTILLYMKFKLCELNATSYEIKQLVVELSIKMRKFISFGNTKFNNQLLFTLLIIGANVCETRDRILIKSFYLKLDKTMSISNKKNLDKIWEIIQEFWQLNPNGVSFDLWQNVLNKYDWNVCVM